MRTKKYTRQEINEAMAQAKITAEQTYTVEYIRERNPKMKIPVPILISSKEFTKYNRYEIADLLELLQKAKDKGATNVHFEWSSYEDNEDIEMIFNSERMEFDSEYNARINTSRQNLINDEMNKVQQQMTNFNREIDNYLILHAKYGPQK